MKSFTLPNYQTNINKRMNQIGHFDFESRLRHYRPMTILDPAMIGSLVSVCTTKTYDHITVTGTEIGPIRNGVISRAGVQCITGSPAIGKYIQKCKFSLRKGGSPTGNALFTIRNSSDTIKSQANLDVSTLTTSFADYEVSQASPVLIALDDRVMIEYTGGDGSNYILLEVKVETTETGYEKTSYDGSYSDNTIFNMAMTFDSTPTCP